MKKTTARLIAAVSCFSAVCALSACAPQTVQKEQDFFHKVPIFSDLRGYIPKPYAPPAATPTPAPAPKPAPIAAPAPAPAPPPPKVKKAKKDDGMVVPDMKPLPPAKKLPETINENPLEGS